MHCPSAASCPSAQGLRRPLGLAPLPGGALGAGRLLAPPRSPVLSLPCSVQARLSGPAASGESSVNPDTDGKKPGLSPRSSLLLTVPSREEPRTAPLQPGPLGLPCPPRPSPRVLQPLHGMSVLALGSGSCPGFLQLMAWACGQPKISALGGGSSPEIPPHDLLAFDLQPGRLDPVFSAWMSRN